MQRRFYFDNELLRRHHLACVVLDGALRIRQGDAIDALEKVPRRTVDRGDAKLFIPGRPELSVSL